MDANSKGIMTYILGAITMMYMSTRHAGSMSATGADILYGIGIVMTALAAELIVRYFRKELRKQRWNDKEMRRTYRKRVDSTRRCVAILIVAGVVRGCASLAASFAADTSTGAFYGYLREDIVFFAYIMYAGAALQFLWAAYVARNALAENTSPF